MTIDEAEHADVREQQLRLSFRLGLIGGFFVGALLVSVVSWLVEVWIRGGVAP